MSSLASRCPTCQTVFRVVPDQLRVSAGWVRCGRCAEVFNASENLVDVQTGALSRFGHTTGFGLPDDRNSTFVPAPPVDGNLRSEEELPDIAHGEFVVDPYAPAPPRPRPRQPSWPAPAPSAPAAFSPPQVATRAPAPRPAPPPPRPTAAPTAPPVAAPVAGMAQEPPAWAATLPATWPPTARPASRAAPAPTRAPAPRLTPAPTAAATAAPTAVPTLAPTAAPTLAPTPVPTPRATVRPTPAPTPAPTAAPTPAPTHAPIAAPALSRAAAPAPAAAADAGADAVFEPEPIYRVDDEVEEARPVAHAGIEGDDSIRAPDIVAFELPDEQPIAAASSNELQLDLPLGPPSVPEGLHADAGEVPTFVLAAERAARWRRPWVRALLGVACLAALGGLGAQVLLGWREPIAARWPALHGALAWLCEPPQCTVQAPRAIDGLRVESSGLVRVERSDLYRLQLTLRNQQAHAAAMPALELSLTDTQGQLIARRVLRSAELGARSTALAAGSELALSATLRVSAAPVAGYTIELFYP